MSREDRLAAAEEWIMRLQMEQEQLDRVLQALARAQAELERRLQRLERRLDQQAPENG
ncbi:MAG: hypothetical protein R3225_04810 [Halofilum sp. (in: g-proteobacteria)]|nr:hypothetical protein [Halofilum sp. (in: g-proteobacteria)]